MTSQSYPAPPPQSNVAPLRLALPLPRPEILALPLGDFLAEAVVAVRGSGVALDGLLQSQDRVEGARVALSRQLQSEGHARKLEALACVYAREVGAALPEAKRGRPGADAPNPYPVDPDTGEQLLDASAAKRYRATLELSPEEFARWCESAPLVSFNALALEGLRVRAERKGLEDAAAARANTPPPAPEAKATEGQPEGGSPAKPRAKAVSPAPVVTTAAPTVLERYQTVAGRLAEDLEEEEDPRLSGPCAETARQLRDQLDSLNPSEEDK